jgi:HK97 family phage prohead protease
MTGLSTRVFALDDIQVRAKGDGRTVEAYAAVFDTPTEVKDIDGHYLEVISQRSFDKSLNEHGTRFGVFYNHARTLQGTPSEMGSVPLGTPLEVRADHRGLYTVTRYNKTHLADQILEAIRNGDITGQSFTGRFLQSNPARGPFRARSGRLTTVTRKEIALVEYGPTPIPVYEDASILGVRALMNRFDDIEALLTGVDDQERAAMATKSINDLPDSAFAYIEPGGSKDEDGKTVPRSKRHFPIHDEAHVRNALARAPQSPFGDKAMPKIRAAAKKFGIEVSDSKSSRSFDEADMPTTLDEEPVGDSDTPDESAPGAVTEEPPDEGHSARRAAAIGWSRTRADIRQRIGGAPRGQAKEEE